MANRWEALGALGSGFQGGVQKGKEQAREEKTYLDSLKEAQEKEKRRMGLEKGMADFPMDGDHEDMMGWFGKNVQFMEPNERWKTLSYIQELKTAADARAQDLSDTAAANAEYDRRTALGQENALARIAAGNVQRPPTPWQIEDRELEMADRAETRRRLAAAESVQEDLLRLSTGGLTSADGQFFREVQGRSPATTPAEQWSHYGREKTGALVDAGFGSSFLEGLAQVQAAEAAPTVERLSYEKALKYFKDRTDTHAADLLRVNPGLVPEGESDAMIAEAMAIWAANPQATEAQIFEELLKRKQAPSYPGGGGLDPRAAVLASMLDDSNSSLK